MTAQVKRNILFLLTGLLLLTPAQALAGDCYLPGDANLDGKVDLSDPILILEWSLSGGKEAHFAASDVNVDGYVDITDAIYLFRYLFQGAAPPVQGDELVGECGPHPSPPPKRFDNVVLIEEDPCFAGVEMLTPGSQEFLRLQFSCPPSFDLLEPGDILVGTDIGGYLRQIAMVWNLGQQIYVVTDQATLDQVFYEGGFYTELDFSPTAEELAFQKGALGDGGGAGGSGGIAFSYPETKLWSGAEGVVTLKAGEVTVDPHVALDMDFGWFSVERVEMHIDAAYSADINVEVIFKKKKALEREKELGSRRFTRFFLVGAVPVVATLELTLSVGFTLVATDKVTATVGAFANGNLAVGAVYEHGAWNSWNSSTGDAGLNGPEVSLEKTWKLKAFLKAEAKVTFYGVIGLTFFGKPYLGAEAKLNCGEIPWKASIGCEFGAGAFFDFGWVADKAKLEPFDLSAPLFEGVITPEGQGAAGANALCPSST